MCSPETDEKERKNKTTMTNQAKNLDTSDVTATYSPEDNKLRLYPLSRFDEETYQEVKKAGYRWAPKQELFVCPAWNPRAEDLALKLCGDIGDEDTTVSERAEERADRFEDYSSKRAVEASQTADSVQQLANGIPFGQPILVGHHSERRARKDAQRIEDGMRKSISLFETSEYWVRRAQGVISSANYGDKPAVRARRIKKLEAERRAQVRSFTPKNPNQIITQQRWRDSINRIDSEPVPHVYVGASQGGHWAPVDALPGIEKRSQRWINHLDRRLTYERALLEAQGCIGMLTPPKRPKKPPILNIKGEAIKVQNRFHRGEVNALEVREMTKAEYSKIYRDYKGTNLDETGAYRVRIAVIRGDYVAVFLSDSKAHEVPA